MTCSPSACHVCPLGSWARAYFIRLWAQLWIGNHVISFWVPCKTYVHVISKAWGPELSTQLQFPRWGNVKQVSQNKGINDARNSCRVANQKQQWVTTFKPDSRHWTFTSGCRLTRWDSHIHLLPRFDDTYRAVPRGQKHKLLISYASAISMSCHIERRRSQVGNMKCFLAYQVKNPRRACC